MKYYLPITTRNNLIIPILFFLVILILGSWNLILDPELLSGPFTIVFGILLFASLILSKFSYWIMIYSYLQKNESASNPTYGVFEINHMTNKPWKIQLYNQNGALVYEI